MYSNLTKLKNLFLVDHTLQTLKEQREIAIHRLPH